MHSPFFLRKQCISFHNGNFKDDLCGRRSSCYENLLIQSFLMELILLPLRGAAVT